MNEYNFIARNLFFNRSGNPLRQLAEEMKGAKNYSHANKP